MKLIQHFTQFSFTITILMATVILLKKNPVVKRLEKIPLEEPTESIDNNTTLREYETPVMNTTYELDFNVKELSQAERMLHNLFQSFKPYFLTSNFYIDLFESNAPRLEEEINHVSIFINGIWLHSEQLSEKLQFSKHIFETMAESIELLRHFNDLGPTEIHLVHCVIDINVRLLSLLGSYGVPDPLIIKYAYNVFHFKDDLNFYRKEFEKLKDIPFGISWMFKKYISQADKKLEMLESQILIQNK